MYQYSLTWFVDLFVRPDWRPVENLDPIRGHQTMRFSFARTETEILEGIRRLATFIQG